VASPCNTEDEEFIIPSLKIEKSRENVLLHDPGETGDSFMVKLIIEPKKAKDGQIEYIVTYHDVKADNQFTVTTTNDLNEAVQRLKETLESEAKILSSK